MTAKFSATRPLCSAELLVDVSSIAVCYTILHFIGTHKQTNSAVIIMGDETISCFWFLQFFSCVSATALTIIISLAACIGLMMLIVGMLILKR